MDDRDHPDTNVVRLRRKGDPGDAERKRLASKIFAEEDDVGTFSRGEPVPPPKSAGHEPEASTPVPDPFFDRLQRGRTEDDTLLVESDSTARYFDQIGSQTPAEMSERISSPATRSAMPGSAQLPGELTKSVHKGSERRRPPNALRKARRFAQLGGIAGREWHARLGISARKFGAPLRGVWRTSFGLAKCSQRPRPTRIRVLAVIGVLVAGITALATIVAMQASGGPQTKGHAADRIDAATLLPVSPRTGHVTGHPTEASSSRSNRSGEHQRRPLKQATRGRRRGVPQHHSSRAASSTATLVVASAPSQAATPSVSAQQAGQPQSTPEIKRSSSTATQSSDASSRSAFGADGILGPGHSPNG